MSALFAPILVIAAAAPLAPANFDARLIDNMAFPQINGSAFSETDTNGTSHNVTLPATVNSGDFLIIYAGTNDTGTFTAPTGWTLKRELSQSQSAGAVFAKVADGTEDGATVSYTFSANTQVSNIAIVGDSWGGAIGDIEVSTGQQKADVNPDPDSVTASWGSDDNLFIASAHIRRNDRSVTTYPTNYTANQLEHASGNASGGARMALASRELAAATDDPGTFTISGTTNSISFTTVIKPAAAGGDTNVAAATEALTLTENTATVAFDVDVQAATEALTLTEFQAAVTLDVDVSANTESLTITENQADIALDVNVQANTESLTITELQASVTTDGDTNVQAAVESLVLTENTATIAYDVNVAANTEALTITEYQATVDLDTEVLANLAQLTITENQATIEAAKNIDVNTAALTITPNAATIAAGATTLTQQDIDNIVAAIFAHVVENSETFAEQIKLIRAEAAGKLSVSGSTVSIRDSADSKDRIVATVDSNGQRTSVTVDGS